MPRKRLRLAIVYDFDGTLAPGNMQEHVFLPKIGTKSRAFWKEVADVSKQKQADNILVYMGLMLHKADNVDVKIQKRDFRECGQGLPLFEGVEDWFDRINRYGTQGGVSVEHYIVSSGLREIIEGTSIGRKFKRIFASAFWYDQHNVARRAGLALNYTTKTQYLFRINKGCLDVCDHEKINEWVPPEQRAIPFGQIIYLGDGETDVPCFRLVKDLGGHSIAVYVPGSRSSGKKRALKIKEDGRVNFIAPADYRPNSRLDRIVKAVIDKIPVDNQLAVLAKRH
jgi:hypothetical protein